MSDKDAQALKLAQAHYDVEVGIRQIFRIAGSNDAEVRPEEPIKLLEVNENTISTGITPLQFDAAPEFGIHYPAVIVEVTPEEFERICDNELILPGGWTVGAPLPRHGNGAAQ